MQKYLKKLADRPTNGSFGKLRKNLQNRQKVSQQILGSCYEQDEERLWNELLRYKCYEEMKELIKTGKYNKEKMKFIELQANKKRGQQKAPPYWKKPFKYLVIGIGFCTLIYLFRKYWLFALIFNTKTIRPLSG